MQLELILLWQHQYVVKFVLNRQTRTDKAVSNWLQKKVWLDGKSGSSQKDLRVSPKLWYKIGFEIMTPVKIRRSQALCLDGKIFLCKI